MVAFWSPVVYPLSEGTTPDLYRRVPVAIPKPLYRSCTGSIRLVFKAFLALKSLKYPMRPRRHTDAFCTDLVRLLSGEIRPDFTPALPRFHPSFIQLSSNPLGVDFHPHFTPTLPSSVCRFPPKFCPRSTQARFRGLIGAFEAIDIVIFMVIHRWLEGLNNSFYSLGLSKGFMVVSGEGP